MVADVRAIGLARLGTVLTNTRAERLRPLIGHHPTHIAVASDPDALRLSAREGSWLIGGTGRR